MARHGLIDLSSDTSTRPSPGMRKAMAEAEVGDEQKSEDPTTNALQERVATLLTKEAAVFLPSGTMCNQIALLVHCRPGDEVIAADMAHIFTSEAGGGSALAGVQTWPLSTKRGIFCGAEVEAALRDPGGRHSPRSCLVGIEQTVNRGGGTVWPLDAIEDVARVAHRHGLAVHMDGARILNAAVASGIAAHRMAAPCDSVWLDCRRRWVAQSAECLQARGRSLTRLGDGSTAWAEPCVNRACLPQPVSMHLITTLSVWRKIMPMLGYCEICSAACRAYRS